MRIPPETHLLCFAKCAYCVAESVPRTDPFGGPIVIPDGSDRFPLSNLVIRIRNFPFE